VARKELGKTSGPRGGIRLCGRPRDTSCSRQTRQVPVLSAHGEASLMRVIRVDYFRSGTHGRDRRRLGWRAVYRPPRRLEGAPRGIPRSGPGARGRGRRELGRVRDQVRGVAETPAEVLRASSWIQGHPEYDFGFKALVAHDGVFDAKYNGCVCRCTRARARAYNPRTVSPRMSCSSCVPPR
jgi:hypothetical protein